ncbi:MAG: hypothetical protein L0387_30980 [Acidobacteria bacterium]|nr:hypothetical protein [Acidobacteriota bacterium]
MHIPTVPTRFEEESGLWRWANSPKDAESLVHDALSVRCFFAYNTPRHRGSARRFQDTVARMMHHCGVRWIRFAGGFRCWCGKQRNTLRSLRRHQIAARHT